MDTKKKIKPIYSKDYYRMEKLIKNPAFQKRVRQYRANCEQIGCPVPRKGFSKYQLYLNWLQLFWKAHASIEQGELTKERERILSNSTLSGREKFNQSVAAADRLLPVPPGNFFEELLEQFGLDSKNEKYKDFLEEYIFLGKQHLSEPLFRRVFKRNEKTDEWEYFVQRYPYTRQEHIDAFQAEIAADQRALPGWRGKNKRWENFERDLEIFTIHQEVVSKRGGSRSPDMGADVETQFLFHERNKGKYERLTLSEIRKAIAKIAALDQSST